MGNISGPYWQIGHQPVTYSLAPWITGSTTTITYTTSSVQTLTNTEYNTMYTTHTFPIGGNFKVQFKINPAYWTHSGYAGILDNDGVVYVFRDRSHYGNHTLTGAEYGNPSTTMNEVWNTGSTGLYTIAMVNNVCKWYVNNILCWAWSASSAPPYRFLE